MRAFLEEGGRNDCQPLVEALFPKLRMRLVGLKQFSAAQLTGTGGCVFASFASQEQAEQVMLERPGQLNGFIAKV